VGATAGDRFQTLGKNNEATSGDGGRGRGGLSPYAASMLRSPGVSMFERPVSKLFKDGGGGAIGGSSGGEQLPYRYFQARPPLHQAKRAILELLQSCMDK
jgi:hypothetical protein